MKENYSYMPTPEDSSTRQSIEFFSSKENALEAMRANPDMIALFFEPDKNSKISIGKNPVFNLNLPSHLGNWPRPVYEIFDSGLGGPIGYTISKNIDISLIQNYEHSEEFKRAS